MTISPALADSMEFAEWLKQLHAIGDRPLKSCPDFPQIARRFDAWWQQEVLDRPLWLASANKNPARPITRRIDLVDQPERWLDAKLADLDQTAWYGEAVPNVRVDLGAACLGALIGAPVEFSSDTTWTHACIQAEDWSGGPSFALDAKGKWWKAMLTLLDATAAAAKNSFLVCAPSPGGLADVLTNLRGATEMCMDVLEQPDRIIHAMNELHSAWHTAFFEIYRRVLAQGAGLIHWHLLWSNVPYVVTECDLGFSIGPADFQRVCLPDIARTARSVGRSIFHLDGAGSTRHLDSLLEIPEIQAIQYTPGAGSPSALAWLDMFRKVQDKQRSLLIFAPVDEVLPLLENLRPEGLAVLVDGPTTVEQLDAVQKRLNARFGGRQN